MTESERLRLARESMYRPEFESDACGVGLVAATDGVPSRRVVAAAIDALKARSMPTARPATAPASTSTCPPSSSTTPWSPPDTACYRTGSRSA
jgi:hypothetical protein